ncbi:hypothetical protein [Clostridium saccharoperbutylacetonicum]|uniref:glycan biosynthesis hexose transferase WsfD n=1 Tax=Clostridium saccharoperbutylacetonicum TaxID=36745 RepID=UPI0039EB0DAA
MKIKKRLANHYKIWFIILATFITIGVLFVKPQIGIADQGDFDRIMSISGLKLLDSDVNDPNFCRFFKYIVTDYQISDLQHIILTVFGSSLAYIIIIISTICKLFGQTVFKTQYLSIIYSIVYISAFSIILHSLNIKNNIKLIVLTILILFIFFDGNYLIWFNSLYGEPMMLVTLVLFIASILNYTYYKYVIKGSEKIMSKLFFVLFTAFLFIGSKLQVLTSLPFILFLVGKIIWDNKHSLSKMNLSILCAFYCILIVYPSGISYHSHNLNKSTQYDSVFYGILKESKTPEQDLIDLGLNPDMSVEAGKSAFLDESKYVKYLPTKSELTDKEFYNKISNFKIAIFYLTHPGRLLTGMEYTASKSFNISTGLGKYYKSYSETPVKEFHRFTFWSSLKQTVLPHNLYFIISIYIILLVFSLYKYIKSKANLEIKTKILLLWTIMLISVIQFPMTFVGNGYADTSKQLFLFNFIFDGLLISIIAIVISKLIDLIKIK